MDRAEQQKPQVAAQVDVGGGGLGRDRLGPTRDQEDPGAEQHRQDRPHLSLDEDGVDGPDPIVRRAAIADDAGILVGEWQAHRHDVHQQDAEHRDAAQHVQRQQALAGAVQGCHRDCCRGANRLRRDPP